MATQRPPAISDDDSTWHELEDLVAEIARLAKQDIPAEEFYRALVGHAVGALAAAGGAIWIPSADGQVRAQFQVNLDECQLPQDVPARLRHDRLRHEVLRTRQSRLAPPRSGLDGPDQPGNPTPYLLVLCPFDLDENRVGLIEVFQRPHGEPAVERGYLALLEELAELAADFHSRQRLRELKEREDQWQRFEDFATRVHGSLDPRAVAYELANEGRRFIGSDRVSVALHKRGSTQLMAASGVDALDRRSNLVRLLERLVQAVLDSGEPLFWGPAFPPGLPPQLEEPLEAYLDQSTSRLMWIVPLKGRLQEGVPAATRPGGTVIGAIVVEYFEGGRSESAMRPRIAAVARHGGLALQHALAHHDLPLSGLLRLVANSRWFLRWRGLPRAAVILAACLTAVTALVFVPADFDIEARGELRPVRRRDLFAPADAVMDHVRAGHAQSVAAGDVVAVLRSPQLEMELGRVTGEIQTVRKQLATVRAQRVDGQRSNSQPQSRPYALAGQEQELEEQLASLLAQQDLLRAQRAELSVKTPITGQVITWNVLELLRSRPVARGQLLMTVFDLEGPWELELQVPDEHMEHVLSARRELGPGLKVAYVLASDPEVRRQARLSRVALAARTDDEGSATVLINASLEGTRPNVRPGATVVARVHCGRRSIGYVWLHDVFAAIHSRLWF